MLVACNSLRSRSVAHMCGNSYFSKRPIDMQRSFWPRKSISTPGIAAISSICETGRPIRKCYVRVGIAMVNKLISTWVVVGFDCRLDTVS
eukprot:COSAG02_NODE_2281_length_9231_cov_15.017959_9_plen_90_part_00